MIFLSCSVLVVNPRRQTTSSWVITLIVVITLLRLFLSFSLLKFVIAVALLSPEETMNLDKLPKSMVFTMNAFVSTATPTFGSTSPTSLIIFPLLLLLRSRYVVFFLLLYFPRTNPALALFSTLSAVHIHNYLCNMETSDIIHSSNHQLTDT